MKKSLVFILLIFLAAPISHGEEGICLNCYNHVPTLRGTGFNSIKKKMCIEPEIGKPIAVNDFFAPALGQQRSFRLTKMSEKKFRVEINPQFYIKKNMLRYQSPELQGKQIYRLTQCFKAVAPFLNGPNGESLEIKVNSSKEVPQVSLVVTEEGASMWGYSKDESCSTIVHETMHLLGLVDEYKDKSRGVIIDPVSGYFRTLIPEKNSENKNPNFHPAFNCRATAHRDSFLANQDEAIAAVLPQYRAKRLECSCVGIHCISIINRNKIKYNDVGVIEAPIKSCPKGFKETTSQNSDFARSDNEMFFSRNNGVDNKSHSQITLGVDVLARPSINISQSLAKVVIPPKNKSLLKPAHFRMITNPYCEEKNRLYYECGKFAYDTESDGECREEAKKCQKNTNWLD